MTSADNAISNAVSIVSAAVLSTNNRVSVVSADLTSFKASLDNFGDVSVGGVTDGQVLMWRSASAQWVASSPGGAGAASVTSAEYASTVSIVSVLQWPAIETVTSAVYSVVEADRGKIKYFTNTAPIEVVLPDGLTSGFQAVIYRASAAGVLRLSAATTLEAQGSALNDAKTAATIIHRGSNAWLALGAFLPAELGTLSNQISVLSQAVSVLSAGYVSVAQQVSVLSQAVSVLSVRVDQNVPRYAIVANTQGLSGATLTDISGLSVAFSTGATYQIHAHIMFSASVAGNVRFGLSIPGAVAVQGNMMVNRASPTTGFFTSATGVINFFDFNAAGNTVIASTASVVATGVRLGAVMDALIVSATAGTLQMMAAVSATNAPINIMPGSFIKTYKLG
jgi:hypothetical protein